MAHASKFNFPIDIVYLWCDGSDPALRDKRTRYMAEAQRAKLLEEEAVAKGRFEDNNELKYALRSLEEFAPFVRNVFLVTDGQYPKWLNISHPKLRIIDHSEIIPRSYLPTFNSNVIEAFVHKIPGLSEHFLLANDDLLFSAAVSPDFFFDGEGRPIVFGMRSKMKDLPKIISVAEEVFEGQFEYNLYYSNLQLYLKTGRFHAFGVHHNIDAYRKSSIEKVVEIFRAEYEELYPCRFRERGRVTRFLPLFYEATHNSAKVRVVRHFSKKRMKWLPRFLTLNLWRFPSVEMSMDALWSKGERFRRVLAEKIERGHISLLCFNDAHNVEDQHRLCFREFVEGLFPNKSNFEL